MKRDYVRYLRVSSGVMTELYSQPKRNINERNWFRYCKKLSPLPTLFFFFPPFHLKNHRRYIRKYVEI